MAVKLVPLYLFSEVCTGHENLEGKPHQYRDVTKSLLRDLQELTTPFSFASLKEVFSVQVEKTASMSKSQLLSMVVKQVPLKICSLRFAIEKF